MTAPPPAGAPLRLLAVTPVAAVGGAEQMLICVLSGRVAEGWDVTCVVPDGDLAMRLREVGVTVAIGPTIGTGHGPLPLATVVFLWRVVRCATVLGRLPNPDAVVVNGMLPLLPLRLLAPRCAVVYYAHDIAVSSRRRLVLKLGRPFVDHVVAVSDAVARPLEALGMSTTVVRNGTPGQVPFLHATSPRIVGCNAALTPWKGQSVLLEALAILQDRSVVVELLGRTFPGPDDRRYARRLRARAEQSDLHGRVRFLGHTPDPLSVMRRWRVSVSASVGPEASGLAVLEAMSIGLPQVCTDHGGPPEVLGDAGKLVPPGDPVVLAAALDHLLADEQVWTRCAQAGPAAVGSWDGVTRQDVGFAEVLRRVARRGPVFGRRGRWTRGPRPLQTATPSVR